MTHSATDSYENGASPKPKGRICPSAEAESENIFFVLYPPYSGGFFVFKKGMLYASRKSTTLLSATVKN